MGFFGQHAAQPRVRPLVHVGYVRHHLDHGPFPRARAPADLLVVQASDQGTEDNRAGPHRLEDFLGQIKHRFTAPGWLTVIKITS